MWSHIMSVQRRPHFYKGSKTLSYTFSVFLQAPGKIQTTCDIYNKFLLKEYKLFLMYKNTAPMPFGFQ